jgi:GPI mannosyltransferase 2
MNRIQIPSETRTQHRRLLLGATLLSRTLTVLLIYISAHLPLFDSSPQLLLSPDAPKLISALLRWDAFHFAHIAQGGYVFEHEWAFFPGTPLVMRGVGMLLGALSGQEISYAHLLLGGALGALLAGNAAFLVYELSLNHLGSPPLALLAATLSLFPSSPTASFVAPYTESFFTYLSYRG